MNDMTQNNIIQIEHLDKIYGKDIKTHVLHDINLSFQEGTFNSIIGQSGSGKTTLLNMIGALDKPTNGSIVIDGKDINKLSNAKLANLRNETMGFVFQFHYLLPEFTALENVLLPFEISGKKVDKQVRQEAEQYLELVDLKDYKNNLVTKLSGGQQQRTAIARALMNHPKILLADEPTGNLDSDSTELIYELLRDINQNLKTTFVIITHDRRIAEKADRIIEIKDGRIHMDVNNGEKSGEGIQ